MSSPDPHAHSKRVAHHFYWWMRAGVTLALVAYLVWQVRPQIGTLQLHLAHPLGLALTLGCIVLAMMLSTWQWYILIPWTDRVSFWQLLTYYLQSLFWNNFLPGGLGGDAVRVLALRAASGRMDTAVSSVLMARITGLWSVVFLAAASALFYAGRVGWHVAFPFLMFALGALILTASGTVFLLSVPRLGLIRRLPAWLTDWHAGLRICFNQPMLLLQALGCAFAIQLCAVAINAFMALALNLAITPAQLLLSLPLINLITLVPISIGGFGVREGSSVYFLGLVGVPAADAIVLALAVYALLALVAAAGAGICTVWATLFNTSRMRPDRSDP